MSVFINTVSNNFNTWIVVVSSIAGWGVLRNCWVVSVSITTFLISYAMVIAINVVRKAMASTIFVIL
jgi:hypothetical protein